MCCICVFDRESETGNERVQRIAEHLGKVETKLYVHFVSFALGPLTEFNVAFQSSGTKIGTMQAEVHELLRGFLANFVKPEVLAAASDLTSIAFQVRGNQVDDSELGIGNRARLLLVAREDELEGTQQQRNFHQSVRSFYEQTVTKIIAKFPFQDKTLEDLRMLDPEIRLTLTQDSVIRLFQRFCPGSTDNDFDNLLREFRDYRATPDNQLPAFKKG